MSTSVIRPLVLAPGPGGVEAMYRTFGFKAVEGTTPPIMVVSVVQTGELLERA